MLNSKYSCISQKNWIDEDQSYPNSTKIDAFEQKMSQPYLREQPSIPACQEKLILIGLCGTIRRGGALYTASPALIKTVCFERHNWMLVAMLPLDRQLHWHCNTAGSDVWIGVWMLCVDLDVVIYIDKSVIHYVVCYVYKCVCGRV